MKEVVIQIVDLFIKVVSLMGVGLIASIVFCILFFQVGFHFSKGWYRGKKVIEDENDTTDSN